MEGADTKIPLCPISPLFPKGAAKKKYLFFPKLQYATETWIRSSSVAIHLMCRPDLFLGSPKVQFQFSLSLLILQDYLHVLLERINILNSLTVLPLMSRAKGS